MLNRWQILICGFLVVHLLFAIGSAAHIPLPNLKAFNLPLYVYREYSGAHYRWGFFAPSIGTQFRLKYVIAYPDGRNISGQIGDRGPEESVMRKQGIVSTFWFALKDKIARRSLCASWASHLFAQFPTAEKVTIVVDAFRIPTMADFRSGIPGRWSHVYQGQFLKDETVEKPQI